MKTTKYKNSWILGTTFCLLLVSSCFFTSCDDELDIVPKGKSTLENVTDLEALLNQEWMLSMPPCEDLGAICNESLGYSIDVPGTMEQDNSLAYAYLTFNENVDRKTLATSDGRYEAAYRYINYMNVLISKMPDAEGDSQKKTQCIAEARVLRAYFHWLLVNIHAKQYDEATAENEGGIAYVDNTNVGEEKTKLTLAETYRRILEDCTDEIIAQLPQKESNVERPDQAFGNAVRAKVLMQMKRYSEALPYAQASLRLNNRIEDRSSCIDNGDWVLSQDAENNLLYIGNGMRVSPTLEALSMETADMFENGDYVNTYTSVWNSMWGSMFCGIPVPLCFSFTVQGNVYGITSDRMYYTAAECLIRTGQIQEGLQMVDRVRAKRVENYEPFAQGNPSEQEAMAMLQKAKWIECIGSYENFFDCKRWNTEANYKRTITRDLGEYGTYTLKPESPLWVLPFPSNVTRYNPSMTQNY